MTDLRLIYITAKDESEARAIGRALVEERLAACANVLPGIASCYWWQGAIAEDREALLVAKTRADLVPELTARVKALHSYSLPCVVALPIVGGSAEYLAWLAGECRPQ